MKAHRAFEVSSVERQEPRRPCVPTPGWRVREARWASPGASQRVGRALRVEPEPAARRQAAEAGKNFLRSGVYRDRHNPRSCTGPSACSAQWPTVFSFLLCSLQPREVGWYRTAVPL